MASKVMPLFGYVHIEKVSQSSSMIFFMCWLIFCDKETIGDIFITKNDRFNFSNSDLQCTTCV